MVQKRLTTASVYSLPDIGDGVYRQKRIGVVVPAFNEERFIADVIETIPSFVDEIVIVDDGSTDATGPTAAKYVEKDKDRISLLRHEKRSGVGSAIVSGYKAALGKQLDIVAVMAGDGQMDPKHLPRLLDPIVENKADYSKGNRLLSAELEQMPRRRIR
ncbi:MAG: glycosyltransferase family 2 protein, partial [Thermoplasmata archaeon]